MFVPLPSNVTVVFAKIDEVDEEVEFSVIKEKCVILYFQQR